LGKCLWQNITVTTGDIIEVQRTLGQGLEFTKCVIAQAMRFNQTLGKARDRYQQKLFSLKYRKFDTSRSYTLHKALIGVEQKNQLKKFNCF